MAAKATAIFDGDDSRLMAAVKRIDRSLLSTQAKFAKFGIAAARWFAAPAAATVALGLAIRKALDVGGHFADLSANTGIAIEDLVLLEQEFRNAGKAGEDVAGVIAKMQDVLVSGAANDTLEKLGLNLAELRKETPLEQSRALGSAIDKMADANDRVAAVRCLCRMYHRYRVRRRRLRLQRWQRANAQRTASHSTRRAPLRTMR